MALSHCHLVCRAYLLRREGGVRRRDAAWRGADSGEEVYIEVLPPLRHAEREVGGNGGAREGVGMSGAAESPQRRRCCPPFFCFRRGRRPPLHFPTIVSYPASSTFRLASPRLASVSPRSRRGRTSARGIACCPLYRCTTPPCSPEGPYSPNPTYLACFLCSCVRTWRSASGPVQWWVMAGSGGSGVGADAKWAHELAASAKSTTPSE